MDVLTLAATECTPTLDAAVEASMGPAGRPASKPLAEPSLRHLLEVVLSHYGGGRPPRGADPFPSREESVQGAGGARGSAESVRERWAARLTHRPRPTHTPPPLPLRSVAPPHLFGASLPSELPLPVAPHAHLPPPPPNPRAWSPCRRQLSMHSLPLEPAAEGGRGAGGRVSAPAAAPAASAPAEIAVTTGGPL